MLTLLTCAKPQDLVGYRAHCGEAWVRVAGAAQLHEVDSRAQHLNYVNVARRARKRRPPESRGATELTLRAGSSSVTGMVRALRRDHSTNSVFCHSRALSVEDFLAAATAAPAFLSETAQQRAGPDLALCAVDRAAVGALAGGRNLAVAQHLAASLRLDHCQTRLWVERWRVLRLLGHMMVSLEGPAATVCGLGYRPQATRRCPALVWPSRTGLFHTKYIKRTFDELIPHAVKTWAAE